MKQLIFTIILIFSFTIAFAQSNSSNNRAFQSGRIIFNDTSAIIAEEVLIKGDSVQYYAQNSSVLHTQALNTVNEIQEYKGNYSGTGSFVGGLAGLAIGVLVALGTEKTETTNSGGWYQVEETKTTIQAWPIYVFTFVGSLVGYLIGAGIPSWETVYNKSTAFLNKMNLKINYSLKGVNFSYRINF